VLWRQNCHERGESLSSYKEQNYRLAADLEDARRELAIAKERLDIAERLNRVLEGQIEELKV